MNWGDDKKVVTPRPVSRGILSLLENGVFLPGGGGGAATVVWVLLMSFSARARRGVDASMVPARLAAGRSTAGGWLSGGTGCGLFTAQEWRARVCLSVASCNYVVCRLSGTSDLRRCVFLPFVCGEALSHAGGWVGTCKQVGTVGGFSA